jgi:phospholipase C
MVARLLVLVVALAALPVHAEQPAACPFAPGALPAETLPAGTPHGAAMPIDHIVVLMQENRSFDHYFTLLRGRRRRPATNPDPTGGARAIKAFHQERLCEVADLAHSWNATHREWNGGAMDGFTAANAIPEDPTGARTMGYYTGRDLPFYYKLYRTFAIGDRQFSALLGPTFPNRHYLLAGTSFGQVSNVIPTDSAQWDVRTIFHLLDEAGIDWRVYQSQVAFAFLYAYVRNQRAANLVPVGRFFDDAAAGTLPPVSFIDPIFFGDETTENDEHPPANVQVGQAFVARVVQAVLASPRWPRTALVVTYDEHGGFYDHVPPPPACQPDGIPPALGPGDEPGDFDRYGIRVPIVVISPYAKKHHVSHEVGDHTAVLRFIETRFDLPALTRRDANASPLLDYFDFRKPSFRKPPRLPAAEVDARRAAECAAP